jgi:Protein of unknown function (DUF3710)
MVFGRRSKRSERAKLDATPPWQEEKERDTPVTSGPWDEQDAPVDGIERLDLGALRIPVIAGVEIRVDVNQEGHVAAATLSAGGGELQLGVFAAPRTAGIWDAVRREIRGSIAGQGGTAQDVAGPFGTELTGRVPVQGGYQSVRFAGVDGPRWFLQALFTGQGATDPARAVALEDALRRVVVVRGPDPMPVRDPLPLRLPKEVAEGAVQQAQAGGPTATTPPAAGPGLPTGRAGAPQPAPVQPATRVQGGAPEPAGRVQSGTAAQPGPAQPGPAQAGPAQPGPAQAGRPAMPPRPAGAGETGAEPEPGQPAPVTQPAQPAGRAARRRRGKSARHRRR